MMNKMTEKEKKLRITLNNLIELFCELSAVKSIEYDSESNSKLQKEARAIFKKGKRKMIDFFVGKIKGNNLSLDIPELIDELDGFNFLDLSKDSEKSD